MKFTTGWYASARAWARRASCKPPIRSAAPRRARASRCATASAAWSTGRSPKRRRLSAVFSCSTARANRRSKPLRHVQPPSSPPSRCAKSHPAGRNSARSKKFLARRRSSFPSFVVTPEAEILPPKARGKTMRFMAIVKAGKDYEAGRPPKPELMAAMGKLAQEEQKLGIFEMGGGLLPSSQGHKVRMSGGKVTVIDGPFAETKEVIGGLAILNYASHEGAIARA